MADIWGSPQAAPKLRTLGTTPGLNYSVLIGLLLECCLGTGHVGDIRTTRVVLSGNWGCVWQEKVPCFTGIYTQFSACAFLSYLSSTYMVDLLANFRVGDIFIL